jgi:hypothetical protein
MRTQVNLKTQNIKGNEPKYKENIGYASVFIEEEDSLNIIVDAFKGAGNSYERRESGNIKIIHNGEVKFEGNINQLIQKL